MTPRFFFGMDVGQAADPTAQAIVELIRRQVPVDKIMREEVELRTRNLRRVDLDTPYPDIIDGVAKTVSRPPFKDCTEIIIDATGVGRPIVDMARKKGLRVIAVTITGGEIETHNDWRWSVPKRNLVMATNLALQHRILTFARGIQEKEVFKAELKNFKVKVSSAGHDSYEAEKSGDHDDMVIAESVAVWRALKFVPQLYRVPKPLPTPEEWSVEHQRKLAAKLRARG